MKFVLIDTRINQFSFSPSGVQVTPNTKVRIATQIGRKYTKLDETHYEITLIAQIKNSEEYPSPFNLVSEFSGLFEVTEVKDDSDLRKFVIEGSKAVYPHLCALFANVATMARVPNLHLPFKSGPVLPEDEDKFAFVVGGAENGNNQPN